MCSDFESELEKNYNHLIIETDSFARMTYDSISFFFVLSLNFVFLCV